MKTKVVWDIASMEVVEVVEVPYFGPWEYFKGDNSKQQMETSNALTQQQLGLQQQQLGMQQNQFNQVNPTLQAIIANGGLTPGAQSAYTSQMINSLPQTYNNLYGNLGQQLVSRGVTGGQNAGGGDIARQFGALGANEAGQAQQGVFNIAQLQQQGLQNALGTSLGIGQQYGQNVGSFGNQATGFNSSATSAANAADQASTGFWGSLFGALGAAQPFKVTK